MRINLDDVIIDVEMVYKPLNRGVYFKYLGDNRFRLNSGYLYSEKEIINLFQKNKNRIIKIMNRIDSSKVNLNTIHYLGKELKLEVSISNENRVFIIDDILYVKCKDLKLRDRLIKDFYTKMVEAYTLSVFDDIFSKFLDLKIKRPTLKFKYTKTFYGKCFRKDNLIEISGICMKMDKRYIDTVIYHELCHFKYLGHQANFYRYFESKLPGAKRLQHEFRMLRYKDLV